MNGNFRLVKDYKTCSPCMPGERCERQLSILHGSRMTAVRVCERSGVERLLCPFYFYVVLTRNYPCKKDASGNSLFAILNIWNMEYIVWSATSWFHDPFWLMETFIFLKMFLKQLIFPQVSGPHRPMVWKTIVPMGFSHGRNLLLGLCHRSGFIIIHWIYITRYSQKCV